MNTKVDYTKPMQCKDDFGITFDVMSVMMTHDGHPYTDEDGYVAVYVASSKDEATLLDIYYKNIFNKPEPIERWINIYNWTDGNESHYTAYRSKEEAIKAAMGTPIATVKLVEVERHMKGK